MTVDRMDECPSQTWIDRALFGQPWNIIKDENSTRFLCSLFCCLIIITVKSEFFISCFFVLCSACGFMSGETSVENMLCNSLKSSFTLISRTETPASKQCFVSLSTFQLNSSYTHIWNRVKAWTQGTGLLLSTAFNCNHIPSMAFFRLGCNMLNRHDSQDSMGQEMSHHSQVLREEHGLFMINMTWCLHLLRTSRYNTGFTFISIHSLRFKEYCTRLL